MDIQPYTDGDAQHAEPDHEHNGDFLGPRGRVVEDITEHYLITDDRRHGQKHSHGQVFQ